MQLYTYKSDYCSFLALQPSLLERASSLIFQGILAFWDPPSVMHESTLGTVLHKCWSSSGRVLAMCWVSAAQVLLTVSDGGRLP